MRNLFILVFIFLPFMLMAQVMAPPFVPGRFEVDLFRYSHMIQIENPYSDNLDTYYAFTDNESNYQIRYAFFQQIGSNIPDIRQLYYFYVYMVSLKAAALTALRFLWIRRKNSSFHRKLHSRYFQDPRFAVL